jgi:ribosomal protein L16 Arg81 hydroxylase
MSTAIDTFHDTDAQAPAAFASFGSLIAPLGKQRFMDEYWERKPFLIKRNVPGYFDSLLSLEAVDKLLGTRVLREPDIRIASGHKKRVFAQIARDGVADRNTLMREHAEGATLVFDQVDRLHGPLDQALAACEAELEIPMRANAFLTPPGTQGFNLHYDTHDVVVLQLAGTKTWQICDAPLPLPHEEQQYDHHLSGQATPIAEFTLEPGDVLFFPRGHIHAASANDATSLHLSLALRTRALREVAVNALRRAVREDPAMRKVALFRRDSTCLAQTRRRLHQLVDQMDLAGALDEVMLSFIMGRSRPMLGRLLALEAPEALQHDTQLKVRADCLYHAFEHEGMIRLALDGKSIALPQGVRPAIDFMRASPAFTAEQLPGLEYESRLLLADKLHAEGLLVRCAQ